MQYEFLKNFPKRMKNIGLYAMIVQNSIQKMSWKQYGFADFDEQMNLILAVLLYIMEQSLREEICTIDDIGAYIDNINSQYLKKQISYEDCRRLGDFIVNVILCNEGRPMYFAGYDFEQDTYQSIHVSYVANRIVYVDQEVRRTSYYLTDDGYNLLLSTLEVENNMKLTIHEMIFQMHLEKQNYDKAVDEIKNVFNLMRIQLQKIQEAMGRIRRNALNYSVKDYEEILLENLNTISETKEKFQGYRTLVKSRVRDLEEENINVRRLDKKEEEKLGNLRVIESYLGRTIDEHQKILSSHFDLKSLYTRELEQLSQLSMIQRFSLRGDFYDKVLKKPGALENLDLFLRPLFNRDPEKIYNLNKAFQYQKPAAKGEEKDSAEELDFDEEAYRREQEMRLRAKLERYEKSLVFLLGEAENKGKISLWEIGEKVRNLPEEREILIPNVEIFKEIMVELIRSREMDVRVMRKEKSEFIQDQPGDFRLSEMLLHLVDTREEFADIRRIEVSRIEDGKTVVFENVKNENGDIKSVRCSNVRIHILREGE